MQEKNNKGIYNALIDNFNSRLFVLMREVSHQQQTQFNQYFNVITLYAI